MGKNRIIRTLFGAFAIAVAILTFHADTCEAKTQFYGNYNRCINTSGGRGSIDSVRWACNVAATSYDTTTACALWIGSSSSSVNPTIYVTRLSGTVRISYWGMCTDWAVSTARIWVNGDNGAIDDSRNMARGTWASPLSMRTTLDIGKFVDGVTPIPTDEGDLYARTVLVGRCNGANASSCSNMYETVRVVYSYVPAIEIEDDPSLCSKMIPNKNSTTQVVSRAINDRLTGMYSGWAPVTYAMPGDRIRFINCYYPGVQSMAFRETTYVHGAHGWGVSSSSNTNGPLSGIVHFDNYFNVTPFSDSFPGFRGSIAGDPVPYYASYGIGDTTLRETLNTFQVELTKSPGKYFGETITTGTPIAATITNHGHERWPYACRGCCVSSSCDSEGHCWCTRYDPCGCYYYGSHTNNRYTHSITYGPASDNSRVVVPYNFLTMAYVEIADDDRELVYSGEKINLNGSTVWVATKENPALEATYATQVDNADVKLVAYVSKTDVTGRDNILGGTRDTELCSLISDAKQCKVYNEKKGLTLNAQGSLSGSLDIIEGFGGSYNVFDADAGDYICFSTSVFPASSGASWTQTDPNGSNEWLIAHPVCVKIAKRPSFHVYGGSLYTEGDIDVSVSTKRNTQELYGYNIGRYNVAENFLPLGTSNNNTVLYGSWAEQAVITQGRAKLFASGASMGLTDITGLRVVGAAEGNKIDFCNKRTPLSFANYTDVASTGICPITPGYTGGAGISTGVSNREALIDYVEEDDSNNIASGTTIDLNDPRTYTLTKSNTGKDVRVSQSGGNINIGAAIIEPGVTHVVKSDYSITISGDIYYADNAYTNSGDIPKVLIYAAGDINISCGVKEIDAVVIAGGQVKTCMENPDINDALRSNQLAIRGAVIASGIDLGRTYGAATGRNSGMSAEIIDYDTSILLWGKFMAGAAESNTLTITYQNELAPRY